MTPNRLRWVLAGGGTGGHVMPALALAERLREGGEAVLFVGAQRGLETKLVPDAASRDDHPAQHNQGRRQQRHRHDECGVHQPVIHVE